MKAILVIDVGENSIGREVNYISVQGDGYSYIVKAIGEDVRLRPLPKEKEILECDEWMPDDWDKGYVSGWNNCLDEIEFDLEAAVEEELKKRMEHPERYAKR